jgi:glycosyltransferase involved in cell wall biosynthesis
MEPRVSSNDRPAVSVIVPAYNVELYVGPALDSVRAQTYADFEVVVVDDGSTDATGEILAGYAARDRRVRIITQSNRGLSAARNAALRASRGRNLAILDSDDLWQPIYLESQLAILDAHPEVDIVTANARYLGGPASGQPARPCPDPRPAPDLANMIADETAVFIMSVFRRRVYEIVGGFDEKFRTNEDYDYWLRAAVAGCRFTRNDAPLGYYRLRGDSLSANDVRMLSGILRVYSKLRPSIEDRPAELAILDSQVERFETELLAAEVRQSLEEGNAPAVEEHLAALHRRRGGAVLGLAALMARWTPGLLARTYRVRRATR